MADQASQIVGQLSVLSILGLTCGSGAFGGMLDVVQLFDVRLIIEDRESFAVAGRRLLAALLLGAIGGVGGAGAMLLVLTATAKLDTSSAATNQIYLMSLAMVSGYLGYRVLRTVARRLEQQLLAEVDAKLSETEKRLKKHDLYQDAINRGLLVFKNPEVPQSEIDKAIVQLEKVRVTFPKRREVNMILANLYGKKGDKPKAIKLLSNYLRLIEGRGREKDVGDAFYNRACFYCEQMDAASNENTRSQLKEKALADLERAVQLSPANAGYAKNDPDLQSLREDMRFIQITTTVSSSSSGVPPSKGELPD